MRKLVLVILSCCGFYVAAISFDSNVLKEEGYSDYIIKNVEEAANGGSNFDSDKSLFTYWCGGGAICLSVYIPNESKVITLPDAYVADDSGLDFKVEHNIESNKICVSGTSAYNGGDYTDYCYRLVNGVMEKVD